jgi:hypothetical protein
VAFWARKLAPSTSSPTIKFTKEIHLTALACFTSSEHSLLIDEPNFRAYLEDDYFFQHQIIYRATPPGDAPGWLGLNLDTLRWGNRPGASVQGVRGNAWSQLWQLPLLRLRQ